MESFARTETVVPEITLAMSEALAKDFGSSEYGQLVDNVYTCRTFVVATGLLEYPPRRGLGPAGVS